MNQVFYCLHDLKNKESERMKKNKSIGAIICILALAQCVLGFLIYTEASLVKSYYPSEFEIFFKTIDEGPRARGTDLFFWSNVDFLFMFFGLSLVLALISLSNLFLVKE